MKKIFFVAISAILLAAGCQKTEIINQVNPIGEPSMTFAPEMGKLTKAAEDTGLDNLKAQDFRLWAFNAQDDPNRGAEINTIYDGMGNILVYNTEQVWETQVAHFWPGTNKKLKFFAVSADRVTYGTEGKVKSYKKVSAEAEPSQYADPEANTKVTINPYTEQITITDFEVIPSSADVDLMIADYEEAHQGSYNGTQFEKTAKLNFRHSLAKVEFIFKNELAVVGEEDPNQVIVQHMYVKNIVTKGTVTVTRPAGALPLNAWTPSTAAEDKKRFDGDYSKESTATIPADMEGAANISQYEGDVPTGKQMVLTREPKTYTTWLVIPQTVGTESEGLEVTIAYLIGKRQFVSTFPLYREEVPSWNPNQYIKYNVSLAPNMIGFSPSVEDWTPVVNDPDKDPATGPNDPSNDGENVNINN